MHVCYTGPIDPQFSRNRIYIKGLRANHVKVTVAPVRQPIPINLPIYAHLIGSTQADVIMIGFLGHYTVPALRFLTAKPIVLDALCSLQDPAIFSRSIVKPGSFASWKIKCADKLAFSLADAVLVESQHQKDFIVQEYRLNPNKIYVVYTGADDELFHPSTPTKASNSTLNVVFRGKFLPEAGIKYIIRAAKLIESENVAVTIIGNGREQPLVERMLRRLKPKNVTLVSKNLEYAEMNRYLGSADISLGQFGNNERLMRTIPHKAYETIAVKVAYITADYPAVKEVLTDNRSCCLVPAANPQALADKIIYLKNHPALRKKIASAGHTIYQQQCNPKVLGKRITQILKNL